jgi:hypothetical protein
VIEAQLMEQLIGGGQAGQHPLPGEYGLVPARKIFSNLIFKFCCGPK